MLRPWYDVRLRQQSDRHDHRASWTTAEMAVIDIMVSEGIRQTSPAVREFFRCYPELAMPWRSIPSISLQLKKEAGSTWGY